jgi:hypothetical protein
LSFFGIWAASKPLSEGFGDRAIFLSILFYRQNLRYESFHASPNVEETQNSGVYKEQTMWQTIKMFKKSHRHTKFFILTWAIYMIAIIWTTVQAYARLEYSRTGARPIVIQIPQQPDS